ncbi:MAG: M24 family metallopeptidase [Candidatus Micrarchaeia archaeon]
MAILLFRGEHPDANSLYYIGVDIDHAFFLSSPRTLFVPRLNYSLAKKLFRRGKVVAYSDIYAELKKVVKGKKLLIDMRSLPASYYKKISGFAKLTDGSSKFLEERMIKRKEEVEKVRIAVRFTKKIFAEVETKLGSDKHGFKTENDVRKFLLIRTMELGLEPAFDPIVASGSNSRFPHYQSGNNAKLRDMVLIDYGVKYKNYRSDLTRCFFLKRGLESERKYSELKQIFRKIMVAFPKFKNGKELAKFAEKAYAKRKFPVPPHSWGHGIGLDVHEFPRLSLKFKDKLKGATMALEPAVYFKDYGLRYEETIYFDGKKAKIL